MNKNPGKATSRELTPAGAGEVGAKEWVRLIPAVGPETATLWVPVPRRDDFGRPLRGELIIDRKLVPRHDLMGEDAEPDLLCSERFVEALESAGATGWKASIVPHVTPARVTGHRLYRLNTDGRTGPFVQTEFQHEKAGANSRSDGVEEVHNGVPLPPVSFDAIKGTGHSVCWSPWVGGPRFCWRALIVRGDVLAALRTRIPDLTAGIEKVSMIGAPPALPVKPGRRTGPVDPPPVASPLDETLEQLERGMMRYRHELAGGADASTIARDFSELGVPAGGDLRDLLVRWNGGNVFGGALWLYGVSPDGVMLRMHGEAKCLDYPIREGWVAFGETAGGHIVWTIDRQGTVRGAGCDGLVYGPDAPFHVWLADQVADLTYAWEHDGEFPWTERMLRG